MDAGLLGFYTWYGFRILLVSLIVIYILSGLDDLIIDIVYYVRWAFRSIFRKNHIKPVTREQLDSVPEKPAVIIVPAWDESNVISRMLLNTASTLLYKNYRIFVGTYPNDEATKLEVEKVREVFSNIEVVVTPANGPTNKADCLNWVYQGILLFEKENNMRFEIFLFHDAEDVVQPLSMKFYNYLIPRVQFIQLPVFPFEQKWHSMVTGCYMDEFAENHTKDMRVREVISSTIPSAGVGTALSREAIDYMARMRKNQIFDIGSVTEDYMLGMLLRDLPGKKIFLQQSIDRTVTRKRWWSNRREEVRVSEPMATREFFPNEFGTAVRQKSRWILGISLQGWAAGWSNSLGLNYCLFRDRKSVVTNLLVMAGYVVVAYVLICETLAVTNPEFMIPPLIERHEVWYRLLSVVLTLFVWRLLNRVIASWRIYGPLHGFMSIPRMFYGNVINFFATWMAVKRFIKAKISGKVPEWGKTSHAYPTEDQLRTFHRKLGDLLLEKRFITASQLETAIQQQKATGKKLGEILIQMGALWEEDLVMTLAHQRNEGATELDPHGTTAELLAAVPRDIAERYRVYPVSMKDGTLVLASDVPPREARSKELADILKRPVSFQWTTAADIQFAIARGYGKDKPPAEKMPVVGRLGSRLVKEGIITREDLQRALRTQKRTHQKLGEILLEMKLITSNDLNEELRRP